jgi:hypothetical protein
MIVPHLTRAHSQLGHEAWIEASSRGRSMSLTEALEDALGGEPGSCG